MSKSRNFVRLLVLAFISCQFGFSQQTPATNQIVLKGATVIDVLAERAVPEAVIVIEGEKIKAFGDANTAYRSDATVVDLAGKFVIPGLVDSHTHYRQWVGEISLNHGVTSVMGMGSRPSLGEDYWRNSQRSDFRTPRLFGTGLKRLSRQLRDPNITTREQVRELVHEWSKDGPAVANLQDYIGSNKQVWQWAAEEAHAAGFFVFGHTNNARESIQMGHDGVEHIWGFAQALMTPQELEDFKKGKYLHWGLFLKDGPRMDQMIREAVQRRVYLNPTMVYDLGGQSPLARKHEMLIYDVYRYGALMTYYPKNLADGLLLKFRSIRIFSSKYENLVPLSRLSSQDLELSKEAYRLSGEFIKRWVQAGGKIMGGTDDPQIGTFGLSAHMEMAMLVEVGLTPMQALQALTIWGAEIMTAKRKIPTKPPVGFIGEGVFADLVVLGANPLNNIDNTRKIERVMKGGKFIELGYTPYYSQSRPGEIRTVPATPEPEISGIMPHTVAEGNREFEMTLEGVGFISDSVVRVDDVSVPTTFVNPRKLKARIPASVVARSVPNRFMLPGAAQAVGVYGDRTVKITVFNRPPDGGTSNSVSLRVQAKWLAEMKD